MPSRRALRRQSRRSGAVTAVPRPGSEKIDWGALACATRAISPRVIGPRIHARVGRTCTSHPPSFACTSRITNDAGATEITPQHYAFLVSDDEFDAIFARIQSRGLSYWADPAKRHSGEINHHYGGRGLRRSERSPARVDHA